MPSPDGEWELLAKASWERCISIRTLAGNRWFQEDLRKEPFTKMHSGYVEATGIVHNHEINNDHYHPKRLRNGVIPGM